MQLNISDDGAFVHIAVITNYLFLSWMVPSLTGLRMRLLTSTVLFQIAWFTRCIKVVFLNTGTAAFHIMLQASFKACGRYFLSNFYFSPNDRSSKTMKNV